MAVRTVVPVAGFKVVARGAFLCHASELNEFNLVRIALANLRSCEDETMQDESANSRRRNAGHVESIPNHRHACGGPAARGPPIGLSNVPRALVTAAQRAARRGLGREFATAPRSAATY